MKTEISSYIFLRKKSYIIDFNFYFTKNKTRLENVLLEICDIIVTTLLNINLRVFVLCFFLISKVVDLNIDILKADKDNSFPFKSRVIIWWNISSWFFAMNVAAPMLLLHEFELKDLLWKISPIDAKLLWLKSNFLS